MAGLAKNCAGDKRSVVSMYVVKNRISHCMYPVAQKSLLIFGSHINKLRNATGIETGQPDIANQHFCSTAVSFTNSSLVAFCRIALS